MLAISSNHVVNNYIIKYDGATSESDSTDGASSSRKDFKYIFVENGFFDLISLPMLPFMVIGHIVHVYGLYLIFISNSVSIYTFFSMSMFMLWAGFGVTAGSHRLWCHRSYQAGAIFRTFLMIGHTMSGQYSIYRWSHGHRTHHKHSDTDADPHNVKRGFTFSHLGWMLKKEHPLVDVKGSSVDCSDILKDPIARFQYENYLFCFLLFSVLIPIGTPIILFGESFINSIIVCFFMRLITQTHDTAFVNSASHMFGDKPYNEKIASTENSFVSFGAIGEGYHNFHHAYPYDYAAGEVGNIFNPTKLLIDLASVFGQSFNRKSASKSLIRKAKENVVSNSNNVNNNNLDIEHEY